MAAGAGPAMGALRPRITGSAGRGEVSARLDKVSIGRDGELRSPPPFTVVSRSRSSWWSWLPNDRGCGVCSGIWWRKASAGSRIALPNLCPRFGCWWFPTPWRVDSGGRCWCSARVPRRCRPGGLAGHGPWSYSFRSETFCGVSPRCRSNSAIVLAETGGGPTATGWLLIVAGASVLALRHPGAAGTIPRVGMLGTRGRRHHPVVGGLDLSSVLW